MQSVKGGAAYGMGLGVFMTQGNWLSAFQTEISYLGKLGLAFQALQYRCPPNLKKGHFWTKKGGNLSFNALEYIRRIAQCQFGADYHIWYVLLEPLDLWFRA